MKNVAIRWVAERYVIDATVQIINLVGQSWARDAFSSAVLALDAVGDDARSDLAVDIGVLGDLIRETLRSPLRHDERHDENTRAFLRFALTLRRIMIWVEREEATT